jgi:hypothetical protein
MRRGGARIESQGDFEAVLVKGNRPNHILHLILSLLTAGLWLIVWVLLAAFGGEERVLFTVDEYGNVHAQELGRRRAKSKTYTPESPL